MSSCNSCSYNSTSWFIIELFLMFWPWCCGLHQNTHWSKQQNNLIVSQLHWLARLVSGDVINYICNYWRHLGLVSSLLLCWCLLDVYLWNWLDTSSSNWCQCTGPGSTVPRVPEGDVYGFLDQQGGGVTCMVKDPSLPQRAWWCRDQACSCWFFCLPTSCGCLMFFQVRLQHPLRFPYVLLPTTAWDLVNHSRCLQSGKLKEKSLQWQTANRPRIPLCDSCPLYFVLYI